MSETHGSDWFPFKFGWKRKKRTEERKPNAADRSKGSSQPEHSSDTGVGTDTITDMSTTEIYSSHRTESGKDKDVPTDMEYAMEATKKALTVLKGIADIVKFPLVKEVIELGISILDTCQSISDVQSGVQGLRERITCLLLSIAESTKEVEESDRLTNDLENLKECLTRIMRRLDKITRQNAFKSSFLSQPNIKLISDCEKDFQDSVQRFQTLRSLEMGQNIVLIQRQLATFYGISLNVTDKVDRIQNEVTDIKSMLVQAGMKSSRTSGASVRIPQLISPLFGREEIVQRIVEQLAGPGGSRICILGPGGMGKTSTALAVMNHSITKATFGEDRYWVPCTQANSIDNFIAVLFKHVKAQSRTGDPLEDIIATLQETDKRRIILLDNFETPWREVPDAENTIRPILSDLDSIPNISILLTMRSEWAPLPTWQCEHLDPIKPEESLRLYTSIHVDAADTPDQLKALLDALGHMPYAITLMASRGLKSGANPEKLLREWKAQGTDMLSKRAEGINRCIELSLESEYVRNAEDAPRILQILSMLPAGVMQENLSIWAGEWSSQAIETLREAALIVTRPVPIGETRTTRHHLVLPVVQSYMAQKDRIPPEIRRAVVRACYEFLRQNNATVKGPNDPLFKEHLAAIAGQEANLQTLLTAVLKDQHLDMPNSLSSDSTADHMDSLLAYIYYQRWMKPRTELAEKVVALAEKTHTPGHGAYGHLCLGYIFARLTRYSEALQAFERAQAAFNDAGEKLLALESELMQSEIVCSRGNPKSARMRFDTLQSRWASAASDDPRVGAQISYYNGFLQFYNWGQSADALRILEETVKALEGLGQPYETANCLHIMARSYAVLQNFEGAIQALDASIKLRSDIFGKDVYLKTPDGIVHLLLRVRYLKGSGRWDDEMEMTLRVTLELSRELGMSRSVAMRLLELGEIHLRKGELDAAQDVYKEAIRKCNNLDDHTSMSIVRQAKQNLKHIDYLYTKSRGSGAVEELFWTPERY